MKGWPTGLMPRPHMSDEIRSVSCQSGPLSISTTFLPALASTAAKVEPDAAAPAITTSTFSSIFSCVAISPPFVGCDVRQVGNSEALVSLHGAVDDIDGVAPQYEIDLRGRRTLPAVDLVLAELIDEVVLLGSRKCCEPFAAAARARFVDAANRSAIVIYEGRPDVDDAGFEQRLARRNRELLVDEMRDADLARARYQGLAQRFNGLGLLAIEQAKRHRACAGLAWCHQEVDSAHRKGQHAHAGAFEKDASFDGIHRFLPGQKGRTRRLLEFF